MEQEVYIQALTVSLRGLARNIITPVQVINTITQQQLHTLGLWDTGATNSVITKSTADTLNLSVSTKTLVRGIHGIREVNIYYVGIILNETNIKIKARVSECDELSAGNKVGMLIGMDIITMGDFVVTNYKGKTTMSFRVPSLQEIDFVSDINKKRSN